MSMKKIFMIALLAVVAMGVSAQTGIRVWYGANVAGNDADGTKSEFKPLNIGVDYTAPIADAFDWSAGVSYQTKGFELEGIDKGFDLGYIQIEANGAWNFVKSGDFKANIFTGPSIGFMVSDDDLEDTKSVDFGWQGGLQGYYKNVSLKVGYEYGFLDVVKEIDSKPWQVFFRLGYTF